MFTVGVLINLKRTKNLKLQNTLLNELRRDMEIYMIIQKLYLKDRLLMLKLNVIGVNIVLIKDLIRT